MQYIRAWTEYVWDQFVTNLPGLARYLFERKYKIVFLGLDNAGKTTLLRALTNDRISVHLPTQRATTEEIQHGTTTFIASDLGGHEEARELWQDYYMNTHLIIFMVDAHDRSRLQEAKSELDSLLANPSLQFTPILVLGNKIDLPDACSETEFRIRMGLQITTGKDAKNNTPGIRPLECFMISVVRRANLNESIGWIYDVFHV